MMISNVHLIHYHRRMMVVVLRSYDGQILDDYHHLQARLREKGIENIPIQLVFKGPTATIVLRCATNRCLIKF